MLFFILAISTRNKTDLKITATESYTISSGETLWEICTKYRPDGMTIQEYIYNVQNHNQIGAEIHPGQTIELLIYEEE